MSAVLTSACVDEALERGADISPCGRYRYRLWRVWDFTRPLALFVMLNPSTADALLDDPTIRRCIGYAQAWGRGGIEVVNLYAYRATKPARLQRLRRAEAIGSDNDCYIWGGARRCGLVVCAWGAHRLVDRRAREVLDLLHRAGAAPTCLSRTVDGHPSHPLYLPRDLEPMPFEGGRYTA